MYDRAHSLYNLQVNFSSLNIEYGSYSACRVLLLSTDNYREPVKKAFIIFACNTKMHKISTTGTFNENWILWCLIRGTNPMFCFVVVLSDLNMGILACAPIRDLDLICLKIKIKSLFWQSTEYYFYWIMWCLAISHILHAPCYLNVI